MSAFLVSLSHIDTLIAYGALATGAPRHLSPLRLTLPADITESGAPETLDFADAETRNELGRELFRANAEALVARYGADEQSALGFALGELYTFQPTTGPADAAAIIGAADCFDYQACEADSYDMSLAQWIVSAIRRKAAAEFRKGWEITNPERDSEVDSIELEAIELELTKEAAGSSRGSVIAKMAAALSAEPAKALPDAPEPATAPLEPAPAPDAVPEHKLTLDEAVGPELAAKARKARKGPPAVNPELEAAKAAKAAKADKKPAGKPAGRKTAGKRDSSPKASSRRAGNASPKA